MKKTFYPQPGPLRALADAWQCRRTVRAWQRRQRRAGRRGRLAARLRAWPYWHATGQLLYAVGFFIEYQVIRAGRWLLWLLGLLLRVHHLLVGRVPEEAERLLEAPGELEPARGSLAERDEEGVLEGHAGSVPHLCNELQGGMGHVCSPG